MKKIKREIIRIIVQVIILVVGILVTVAAGILVNNITKEACNKEAFILLALIAVYPLLGFIWRYYEDYEENLNKKIEEEESNNIV